jgi:alcohol/geraniol dehydrogenase (NADP+)
MIRAYAAHEPGGKLEPFEYEPGALGDRDAELQVDYCGLCHSDLSMLNNAWGVTRYPFVPGHEVIGTITAVGDHVTHLKVGQRVGLGWTASSCMYCQYCMSGDHNLCLTAESTIVGRHGGFADRVRAHESWLIPLPDTLNPKTAGPLFCGGLTVFNPIVQLNIKPTDRVGVIGIGGLGHLALQFLHAWGCDVTAFSTTSDKEAEARQLGANHFINTRDPQAFDAIANSFDMILSTVEANLNWPDYLKALRPKGKLHFVGVPSQPILAPAFSLIPSQRSLSGSPLGSPATAVKMLDFAARHGIEAITENYPFEQINEAFARLDSGQARYRIVLTR